MALIPKISRKKLIALTALFAVTGAAAAGLWWFHPEVPLVRAALSKVGLMTAASEREKPDAENEGMPVRKRNVPEVGSSEIIQLVRTMLVSQTGLATGLRNAPIEIKKNMGLLRAATAKMDVAQLTTQEIDAVTIYVLSGGDPSALEKILANVPLTPERHNLLEGALAFVKGDLKAAREKTLEISAEKFGPVLAARILMMQAQLQEDAPVERRMELLKKAANLANGTLLEEASNRRLVEVAAASGAASEFYYWAARYQRRFPNSVYFQDYWSKVLDGVFESEKHERRITGSDLHRLVFFLSKDRRLKFLQELIVRAIRIGDADLCRLGVSEGVGSDVESAQVPDKLRIFLLACSVVGQPERTKQELATLDLSLLDANEIQLLDAVAKFADGIMFKEPQLKQDSRVYGPQPTYPGMEDVVVRAASVAQQLDATEAVLKRAGK